MRLAVFIKCGDADAVYYLNALKLACISSKIDVFRDTAASDLEGVEYITTPCIRNSPIRHIVRFVQAIARAKPTAYIGVYEVPHGLYAFLLSVLFQRKFVLSVIGNPSYKKVRKGIRLGLMRIMLKYAHAVTVTGEKSKAILHAMDIPLEKIFVLPNIIPVQSFRLLDFETRKYDLISLGRLSPEKHVATLVDIVNRLHMQGMKIRAAIAGKGPDLEQVKKLSDKYGLNGFIEFLGYIPDRQLESFFNSGKIFVLCSETEGFPRTILQAASCGACVVSSSVGDIPDIIRHGLDGFLVDPYNDVDQYAKYVMMAIKDIEGTKVMANSLLAKVHKEFSIEAGAQTWIKILQRVIV